ncbi:MAG: DUF2442 domain-containing protein [Clostridia bacterium]|nr:DUF2442 domain-containing protein [Clostridia bacterium]
MYPRIKEFKTLPGFMLSVLFDDGTRVLYDVKEDFSLPEYDALRTQIGLFDSASLDDSRTVIYWNDRIDLPSDQILEYGKRSTYA